VRRAWPVLWLLFPGCIPLAPHYDWRVPSRMNMEKALESFRLTPETRDEDVILAFGEPDDVIRGAGTTWVYQWEKVIGRTTGTGFPAHDHTSGYVLTVDFDHEGRVLRMSPVEDAKGRSHPIWPWD